MEKLGLVAAAVAQGLQEEEIEGSGVAVLAVDLEVEELLAVVVGVEEEGTEVGEVGEDGELAYEGGDEEGAEGVVDVLAVALEGGVDLLAAEVEGVGPADAAVLHEEDVWVLAVVPALEEAVVEAGVDHEQGVAQVEGVGDRVLVEEDLLLVAAQVLRNAVEVDDAVVDGLLVAVVLADPQPLRDRLQALLQAVHLQVHEGAREDAVIDLVAHQAHLRLLLEEVAQALVEVAVDGADRLDGVALLRPHQRVDIAALVSVVVATEAVQPVDQFLGVGRAAVVLEVELDLLDGLGEHELVLGHPHGDVVYELVEALVNPDYLLEVQLLEVDVHPPYQEVYQVTLLQLVVPQAPEGLQHL